MTASILPNTWTSSLLDDLTYFLLDSIFEEAVDDTLTPEQQAELESRLEAFERGEMELISGEDFANKLKARHGL